MSDQHIAMPAKTVFRRTPLYLVTVYQKRNEIEAHTGYKETQLLDCQGQVQESMARHHAGPYSCLICMSSVNKAQCTAAGWTARKNVAHWPCPSYGTLVPGQHAGGTGGLCLPSPYLGPAETPGEPEVGTWVGRPHGESTGACGGFTWAQRETVFPCIQRRLYPWRVYWNAASTRHCGQISHLWANHFFDIFSFCLAICGNNQSRISPLQLVTKQDRAVHWSLVPHSLHKGSACLLYKSRAPSNLTLNVSRDGASTTSLGNLLLCFTSLIVKNFFLISSLNLPPFSLKPLLLVLLQQALLRIMKGCNKVSLEPSLLQAEQPHLSQPVFIGEVFQPSDHFCGPPLDLLQQVHLFPVLRAPELDAVLQNTVGLLGCERTLSAHVQLFIHQYPQVLLCRAALNHIIPQPVLILGVAPTQLQDPALGLVDLHEGHTGPLLELVQVPLDGILSLRCVNHTTQLGVICKLAEGALNPAVYAIDEDIKQHWSQYGPLRDATCH
ncbi:hypothetical protein QYF61_006213 [Mycteria americana]|uniref:Uncharacterized protein n=1 Tax=Mycteria americana TaxID=33587 RepID=A0AAN7N594_MYCAM|nr:hypothetical protein QYF61_006213 [Mycteria americana]